MRSGRASAGYLGELMSLKSKSNFMLAGLVAAALAGCSADDVQLNGKVFDAMGMNTSSNSRDVPEMGPRSGIVVPPNLSSLPQPGSGKAGEPALAEIQDYDAKRTTSRTDLEKQQADYCAKHYDMAKAMGNQDAELVEGPMGRCQKSVLSLAGWGESSTQPEGKE